MRKNSRNTLLMGLGIISLVLSGLAHPCLADEITIDTAKTHQTIDGFGVCGTEAILVNDLGISIIRTVINPSVLAWEVEKAEDIHWKDFKFTGSNVTQQEAGLKRLASTYQLNPDEIKVFGTPFSPPAWMKSNGYVAYGGNLKKDRQKHYAKYLAEYATMLKERYGVPLHAMSVNNEMFFTEPYASCVYVPGSGQFGEVVKEMGRAFKAADLEHIKVLGPEDMTKAVDRVMSYLKEAMDDDEAKNYLGICATHGYAADGITSDESADSNTGLADALTKTYPKLRSWMTESSGELPAWEGGTRVVKKVRKKAIGAFGFGRKIHNCIVHGNMNAYVYWMSNSAPYANEGIQSLLVEGKPTKKFYTFKHYSKFIRPDAIRVDAVPIDTEKHSVSAFHHKKHGTFTIYLMNHSLQEESFPITLQGPVQVAELDIYQTTAAEDMNFKRIGTLPFIDGKATLTLPSHAIVTLYGKTTEP